MTAAFLLASSRRETPHCPNVNTRFSLAPGKVNVRRRDTFPRRILKS